MRDSDLDGARARVLTAARASGALGRGAPTRPAMERYDGVLYRELRWSSLPEPLRRRGAEEVRIVSGLLGLAAPDDPVPAYRLKMSASLPETGKLSTWWRPRLAPVLARLAQGSVVWDLLPNEHSAACVWTEVEARQRVRVRFVDAEDRTVSHWNKLLKGALVEWILAERPASASGLAGFDHPLGYRLDDRASTLDEEVAIAVFRQIS